MADSGHTSQELHDIFDSLDEDNSGCLSIPELKKALIQVGMEEETFKHIIHEADKDKSGTVDKQEFFAAMEKVNKKEGNVGGLSKLVKATKEFLQVTSASGGLHTYSQEELHAFADHINNVLGQDSKLKYLLPIDAGNDDLFKKVSDGVLLARFVNCIQADTIDMRVVNFPKKNKKMTIFKVNENLNLVINACKGIGVIVHNVGAGDIREVKNPSLLLGLLWQMVKMHLLSDINLKDHPELLRLLGEGEDLQDFLALSPEEILKRWLNYHLKEAGSERRVHNFGNNLKDSEVYTIVMNHIDPKKCSTKALDVKQKTKRAEMVLDNAKALGCSPFISPKDIVKGNEKLNLAFVADLFNTCPGLEPVEIDDKLSKELAGLLDDDNPANSREERAFRMWANCLGIDDFYLNNLDDLCDGLNLLKVIDAVEPGIVNWKKVEKKCKMVFKKNSNHTYAVALGKSMNFSLVGIGGVDITQKNKKLVLAFLWQLFRYHSIKFLKDLGDKVDDKAILEFANDQVKKVEGEPVSSFRDKTISTGHFVCNLVKSVDPEVFDDSLITSGSTEDECILNARYAISVARKHNMCVFCLPEDIYEVNNKLILTFCAAVMQFCKRKH